MKYNPEINTYPETPSKESVKAATMVTRFMFWMMNESSQENFIGAFGNDLGNHF